MNSKTHDTRHHILDVGYQLVVQKGFTSVGLSELLKTADVPKGSFYHYFKSKEQFGEALIEDYFMRYRQRIHQIFSEQSQNAYQRLMTYFQHWLSVDDDTCNANRCLIVKLSAEVSDLSEPMRLALAKGSKRIIETVANIIEQGQQDGSILVTNSHEAALDIYHMWIGASVLNKLFHDQNGLTRCLAYTEQRLKQP
ncbi:TetR/AcrR family transcriptional regulator [Vibrio olivae]|uniref:TetR/AcrR family transcriptional regulator n=1 Tax=Vibrio olivae TaxID=1243002 RepID=A0ABV5HNU7_9VIBR